MRSRSIPHLAELALLGAAALVFGLVAQALSSQRFAAAAAPTRLSAAQLESDLHVAPPPVLAGALPGVGVPALPRPPRRARPHRRPAARASAPVVVPVRAPLVAAPTPPPVRAPVVTAPVVVAPKAPPAKPAPEPARGPSFDSSG